MKGATWLALAGALAATVLLAALEPVSTAAPAGQPPTSFSAWGTPTIDGVIGDAEWATADAVDFSANLPDGTTTPGRFLVMNDAKNLYFALRLERSSLDHSSLGLYFDRDHDGIEEPGDDDLVVGSYQFYDDFRTPEMYGSLDTENGGTIDGGSAASNDGKYSFYEAWHPLDSADDAHDISVAIGDTVGLRADMRICWTMGCADTVIAGSPVTPYGFADLTIASNVTEFSSMSAVATLFVPPGTANDRVMLISGFRLGPGSNGIDPATERVETAIGGVSLTLPGGSFAKMLGGWTYRGRVDGVDWTITIDRLLAGQYLLAATASRLDLKRPAGPIDVRITIGDDEGERTVTPLVLPTPRRYRITDLGTLGSGYSEGWGINSSGQVFGLSLTATDETHGFVWTKGQISDLGTLGGILSYPTAMNDRGQIVGYTDTGGFIWEKGMMSRLETADGQTGAPFGINERGLIVGYYDNPKKQTHGFLFEKGVLTDLGGFDDNYSRADTINERGQVIGNAWLTPNGPNHAFIWEKGKLTDLGTLGGDTAYPTGINDHGQIAGHSFTVDGRQRAFLWEKGTLTDLGALAYGYSISGGINNRGQIVGWSYTPDGAIHGFVWEKGVMTDLGTLGGRDSRAEQINDHGVIIGTDVNDQGETHAFAWENGVMTDLGTLGGDYSRPGGINEKGQIVGTSTTASGETHAVLWTPVP